MRIVCALDVHRRQITYARSSTSEAVRCRGVGSLRQPVTRCNSGWRVRRLRRGAFFARGRDGLAVRRRGDEMALFVRRAHTSTGAERQQKRGIEVTAPVAAPNSRQSSSVFWVQRSDGGFRGFV
jgi:hypothetical protein